MWYKVDSIHRYGIHSIEVVLVAKIKFNYILQ